MINARYVRMSPRIFRCFLFVCVASTGTVWAQSFPASRTDYPISPNQFNTDVRSLHALTLSGSVQEQAFQHGQLLATEIESGSLVEALQNIEGFQKDLKPAVKRAFQGLYSCIERRMIKSTSPEFNDAIRSLHAGYSEGKSQSHQPIRYSHADLRRALYSIEVGNYLGGLIETLSDRQSKNKHSRNRAILRLAGQCGVRIAYRVARELDEILVEKGFFSKSKFACTAAVVPAHLTEEKKLIHGRNLEQTSMIQTWNKHPTLFFIQEPKKFSYVAFGTAGLIFPGGISGFNDQGITVSLHQFSSTVIASRHRRTQNTPLGGATMGPELQQQILRNAGSIDEAIQLIQKTPMFSAWAIAIGDSKTNEVASIEITPTGAVVAKRVRNAPLAQVNLFLHPTKDAEHFHSRHNQYLENRSRLNIAEAELQKLDDRRQIDLQGMINLLASHQDFFENSERRAFGRSIARVSNIMSTIVIPDPSHHQGEAWITVADMLPANHGNYFGFRVHFSDRRIEALGAKKNNLFENQTAYEQSFDRYHRAYQSHVMGNDGMAIEYLTEAIKLAKQDGIDEFTYHWIRGRLYLNSGKAALALADFETVAAHHRQFHPLRQAMIQMLTLRARDLLELETPERARWFEAANQTIDTILETATHGKKDLRKKKDLFQKIAAGNRDASGVLTPIELPAVDMSTVE